MEGFRQYAEVSPPTNQQQLGGSGEDLASPRSPFLRPQGLSIADIEAQLPLPAAPLPTVMEHDLGAVSSAATFSHYFTMSHSLSSAGQPSSADSSAAASSAAPSSMAAAASSSAASAVQPLATCLSAGPSAGGADFAENGGRSVVMANEAMSQSLQRQQTPPASLPPSPFAAAAVPAFDAAAAPAEGLLLNPAPASAQGGSFTTSAAAPNAGQAPAAAPGSSGIAALPAQAAGVPTRAAEAAPTYTALTDATAGPPLSQSSLNLGAPSLTRPSVSFLMIPNGPPLSRPSMQVGRPSVGIPVYASASAAGLGPLGRPSTSGLLHHSATGLTMGVGGGLGEPVGGEFGPGEDPEHMENVYDIVFMPNVNITSNPNAMTGVDLLTEEALSTQLSRVHKVTEAVWNYYDARLTQLQQWSRSPPEDLRYTPEAPEHNGQQQMGSPRAAASAAAAGAAVGKHDSRCCSPRGWSPSLGCSKSSIMSLWSWLRVPRRSSAARRSTGHDEDLGVAYEATGVTVKSSLPSASGAARAASIVAVSSGSVGVGDAGTASSTSVLPTAAAGAGLGRSSRGAEAGYAPGPPAAGYGLGRGSRDLEGGKRPMHVKSKGMRNSIWGLPVLSPLSSLSRIWGWIMLLMDAVYVALAMPINAAFCPLLPGELTWCSAIDLGAGCVYLVNLLLCFQIGFVLAHEHDYKKRRVLQDGPLVARFYCMRGSMVIDTIAIMPLCLQLTVIGLNMQDYWANRTGTFLMLLRLVRLVALMRVLFVDSIMSSNKSHMISKYIPVMAMYAGVMCYAVLVLVNLLACLAWLTADMEGFHRSWVTKVESWIYLPDADFLAKYALSFYWVFTTITSTGYGDITPVTIPEVILAVVFQLVGVTMFALLIGSMSEILTQTTADARKARQFREKLQEVQEWLGKRNGIPAATKDKIRSYYSDVWLHHTEHPTEAKIWSELPSYLRAQVASDCTKELLAKLPLFAGVREEVRELISELLSPEEVAPGHELCHEGDIGDRMWVLQEGKMQSLRHGQLVMTHTKPAVLGESILLAEKGYFAIQPLTYRAKTSCSLWELSLKDLRTVLSLYPDVAQQLHRSVRDRFNSILARTTITPRNSQNSMQNLIASTSPGLGIAAAAGGPGGGGGGGLGAGSMAAGDGGWSGPSLVRQSAPLRGRNSNYSRLGGLGGFSSRNFGAGFELGSAGMGGRDQMDGEGLLGWQQQLSQERMLSSSDRRQEVARQLQAMLDDGSLRQLLALVEPTAAPPAAPPAAAEQQQQQEQQQRQGWQEQEQQRQGPGRPVSPTPPPAPGRLGLIRSSMKGSRSSKELSVFISGAVSPPQPPVAPAGGDPGEAPGSGAGGTRGMRSLSSKSFSAESSQWS